MIANLRALAARTSDAQGAQRVAWGPVWRDARLWLDELLAKEGLRTQADAAGNNWITVPGQRPDTVIIGGHLDSVPNGGWLDGPLGVLAGVEALRRYAGTTPPVTLAVADFADEEGARFSRSLLGSSGASGSLVPDRVRNLVDRQGVRLADALAENGVDVDRMPEARQSLDARRPRAYLELHIEQGPVLESMGRSTGAVIGTYGVERHVLRFTGQAAHSGSTPIAMRRDAFLAAAETALACREIARRHSTPETGMVCTVGTVSVEPGIVTAVPGVCEIALDQRALEPGDAAQRPGRGPGSRGTRRRRQPGGGGVAARVAHRPLPVRSPARRAVRGGGAGGDRAGATAAVGPAARRRRDGPGDAGGDDVRRLHQRPVALQGRRHAGGRPRGDHRGVPPAGRQDGEDGGGRVIPRPPASAVTQSAAMSTTSKDRRGVVGLLILLFAITYLDRVCISVAGPRMQAELGIDPIGWGWVTGIFTFAYCVFEIPTGTMGDRLGPRLVLTRIVVWWSAFTALTGTVTSYYPLLLIRFLFGAGEAGAFPNASVVVARWFPPSQRATMSGVNLMASQIGGAIAPLLIVPIQMRYGWRMSFYVFGVVGLVWAAVWYAWFRDSPEEKQGLPATSGAGTAGHGPGFPWRAAARSPTIWAILGVAFCYIYVYNFFQTWFHTFLVRGRGFSEGNLVLSALPFVVAAFANLAGGAASDALVRRLGNRRGRRFIGATALAMAAVFTVAAMFTQNQLLTVVLLAATYGAITFQQSGVFGVCLDIGGPRAGATVGLMNMVAQVGGLVGSVVYGYIVTRSGSYDAPFIPMAVLLCIGAALWLKVDASETLGDGGDAATRV